MSDDEVQRVQRQQMAQIFVNMKAEADALMAENAILRGRVAALRGALTDARGWVSAAMEHMTPVVADDDGVDADEPADPLAAIDAAIAATGE